MLVFPRMEVDPCSKGPATFRLPDSICLEVRGSQQSLEARNVFTSVYADHEGPGKQSVLVNTDVSEDVGSLKAVEYGLPGVRHPDEPSRGSSLRLCSLLVRDVLVHHLPVTLLYLAPL